MYDTGETAPTVTLASPNPGGNIEAVKPILRYSYLGFYLVSLLDHGKALNSTETIAHINDGSLFSWLGGQFQTDIDLSVYGDVDKRTMLSFFRNLAGSVDAKRKFGVEHNGVALLAAYCLEGMQQLLLK